MSVADVSGYSCSSRRSGVDRSWENAEEVRGGRGKGEEASEPKGEAEAQWPRAASAAVNWAGDVGLCGSLGLSLNTAHRAPLS